MFFFFLLVLLILDLGIGSRVRLLGHHHADGGLVALGVGVGRQSRGLAPLDFVVLLHHGARQAPVGGTAVTAGGALDLIPVTDFLALFHDHAILCWVYIVSIGINCGLLLFGVPGRKTRRGKGWGGGLCRGWEATHMNPQPVMQ